MAAAATRLFDFGQAMVLEVGKQFVLATVPGLEADATAETKRAEVEKVVRVFSSAYSVGPAEAKVRVRLCATAPRLCFQAPRSVSLAGLPA